MYDIKEKITYTFTISKQEYLSTYMKCGTSMLKKIATESYCSQIRDVEHFS